MNGWYRLYIASYRYMLQLTELLNEWWYRFCIVSYRYMIIATAN